MSLTVPSGLQTRLPNRSENWVVQLFNSSKTHVDPNTNEELTANETELDVTSGSIFNVDDIIMVHNYTELMKVTAVNSNTLTVQRRYMGTAASATLATNKDVWKRNFIGLSFSAVVLQDQYYEPCILNMPSIRESIDLDAQTSSRSNVSIKIANFTYQGAPFSEQLHNGTNAYLNQLVRIYIPPSQVKSTTGLKDCLQIYEGRLVHIAHDAETITLEINSEEPWKDVSIPNVKHTDKDIYQPIVYGGYTAASYQSEGVYGTVFPVPIMMAGNGLITTVMPKSYTSGAHLQHYGGFNWFIGLGDPDDGMFTTTATDGGVHVLKTPATYRAQGWIRLEDSTKQYNVGGASVTYMTNSGNAFTYNRATGANSDSEYATATMNSGLTPVYIVAQTPGKKFTSYFRMLALRYSVQGASHPQDYYIQAFSNRYASTDELFTGSGVEKTLAGNISAHSFTFNDSPDNAASWDSDNDGANETQNGPVPPDDVLIKFNPSASEVGGHSNHTLRVYDVRLKLETIFKGNDDDYRQIEGHKYFYCGADGLHDTQVAGNYWIGGGGSSTNITKLHQMHRDLLHRFTYLEQTPDNWTSLNSEHSWDGRLWQLEPTKLSDLLKKIQTEGQFIFRLKNDNTPQYIFVPNNPHADHILTKQDISTFQVSDTDFRSITTKYVLNFHKHPAESGKYIQQTEVEDSTPRTLYNIQTTNDNTKTIDFDYLVDDVSAGSNINSSWHNYRKQLFGTVKTIIKCKVINPQFYNMDVGDIVALEDMHIKAFNVDYTDTAFMITSVQRKLGEMDIELREVATDQSTGWTMLAPFSTPEEGEAITVQMANQHWKARTMNLELYKGTNTLVQTILSGAEVEYTPGSTSGISWTPANLPGPPHNNYKLRATCLETGSVSESSAFSITPA